MGNKKAKLEKKAVNKKKISIVKGEGERKMPKNRLPFSNKPIFSKKEKFECYFNSIEDDVEITEKTTVI